jgi:hypothetical protein
VTALPSAPALALRAEPVPVSSLRASIGNAALRDRLLRKAALLTQRHSEMANTDAPPLVRLGWMRPYRMASNAVFKRLHAIEMPL